jgi:pyruvate-ferredoxin/flavodoxin oxidoreductase
MVDVTGSARRLYRRIVRTKAQRGETHPGVESIAVGHTAVAMTEAGMSEAVALGGSYPAAGFSRDFSKLERDERVNLWRRPLSVLEASSPRGSLAEAMGLAMSGMRATAFLSGTDLSESIDLLSRAAGRRLPLVVQLAARARAGHGATGGGGHDLVHAAGDTGAVVLVAANVQEAVDFSLVAHRTAEDALAPVVVAMDGEETALSVQDLLLPHPHVVRQFVGDPDENIHPPASSQELLFGKHRRRVPRWHDPERPFLTGPSEGSREFALGEAGRFAYLDSHVPGLLENALVEFDAETGRLHAPVSEYRTKDAELVLVGMGAVVESLEATADHLRRTRKIKVGAVGIRVLRPFPAARIVELLSGRNTVAVLERVSPEPNSQPPLLRDIQAALDRAHQNARYGASTHSDVPAVPAKDLPRLATVFYGLGGSPVRSADLEALGTELSTDFRSPIFLGLTFSPAQSEYPKRQVLLDALKRHYPDSENLGLRGDGSGVPVPADTLCVSVHRMTGRGGEQLAGEAATMLHGLGGGHVRSRTASVWDRWGAVVVDRFLAGSETVKDPGEDIETQVVVWVGDGLSPIGDLTRHLVRGGAVLLERDPKAGSFLETLPGELRRDVLERGLKLYTVTSGDAANRDERLLGALLGLLQKEGKIDIKARQLLAERRGMIEDLDEAEREACVTQLQAGFDLVMPVETGRQKSSDSVDAETDVLAPRVVRRLRRTDDAADSLARFWDQVGVLYRRRETGELAPDPYLAVGVMPPLSSAFRDLSFARDMFPAFDPARCTGCGDCWSVCPDSSMTPLVIGAGELIEAGMALAKEQGQSADALRMAVSKLAARTNEVLAENPTDASAEAVLGEAFLRLMKKMTLPEDRKQGVEDAFKAARDTVSRLPLVRTGPFFDEPEAEKKGTGELFSLAMSPDACKGCALCVAVFEPQALSSLPEDTSRSWEARKLWELFEALPDPNDATLERAREHDEVGPVAAAMLTREVRESFAGGDGAEPGSGEKTALRELLAVAYSRLMPRYREHVEAVEGLRDRLSEAIRDRMAKVLPTGDLDALSQGLSAVDRPDINLAELSDRVETAFDSGRVDVAELQRLVEAGREVNDLHWHLTKGDGGLGITPFGIVFGAGSVSAWASTFPNNPFGVPVAVDGGGETAELAVGLLEGQLQGATRGAGVLRRAEMELTDPKEAARSADATRRLVWRDLSAEERGLIPPLFLVVNENSLGRGFGGLSRILSGDLPVTVVVLSDVDLGIGTDQGLLSPSDTSLEGPRDLGLRAMAHGKAFVAQTSVADPKHLDRCVVDALAHDGPSLLRLHAPSPGRHGFPKDMAVTRAREALRSRAFPLFRFDPANGTFGVTLDGNPEPGMGWAHIDESLITPAHWALGEKRFSRAFSPVEEDAETVELVEYLDLAAEERSGKTAVLQSDGATWAVSDEMIEAVVAGLETWRTLQRLGRKDGAEETKVVEAASLEKLEEQHAAELASVQQQYEAQLQGLSTELRVDMAKKVRGRLLALLQRRAGNGDKTATSAEPTTATATKKPKAAETDEPDQPEGVGS